MEIRELYSVAKQESVPCSNRGEVSEDYILVKLGFSRAIGSRRSLDCPLIWEERTLLDDRQLWLNLPGVKMLSLSYRTLCTQKVTESLSSMRVPEDEHPNAIDRLFEALDSAVSPELPINVSIWDMILRFGGSDDDRAATESMEMYKPNLVPATRSSIEGLERVRLDGCEGQCVICLEDFAAVDQLITRLPCSHYFHGECIVQSLEISHLCPLCRYPMPTLEEPQPT